MLLNWYNTSASGFFNLLGRAFDWSFRILQKFGIGPNVFYISIICFLLLAWLYMLSKYAKEGKDKGLID